MPEAISGGREFHGHEWIMLPVEKLHLARIVSLPGFQIADDAGMDDPWQEVIEHHPLIVKPDQALHCREVERRIIRRRPVVESVEQALELADLAEARLGIRCLNRKSSTAFNLR